MPIRFLLPIFIAALVAIGFWKWPQQESVIPVVVPPETVVQNPAPTEVLAPPNKQEVVSAPVKTETKKPDPKPVIKPTPPPPAPMPQPASTPTPVVQASYSVELLSLINSYRAGYGVGSLAASNLLNGLANEHSNYMVAQGSLSHDGFDVRFEKANRSSCVENVGWNYATASAQLNGWIKSPGHNKNLLNPNITLAGIAKSGAYVTFFACQ